jgi:photoactive yellow protein
MNAQSSHTQLPYGLLELDASGLVVRYAPAFEQTPSVRLDNVLGQNFFTEVVRAPEIKDCQARFRLFMEHGQTTERFTTTFPSEQGPVKVQIMLARIFEKTEHRFERLALVRIMPEEGII